MPKQMKKWRDYRSQIVHAYNPTQITADNAKGSVVMQCGEPMILKCVSFYYREAHITQVPSGKRLTSELLSVKAQVTCLGCLGES